MELKNLVIEYASLEEELAVMKVLWELYIDELSRLNILISDLPETERIKFKEDELEYGDIKNYMSQFKRKEVKF